MTRRWRKRLSAGVGHGQWRCDVSRDVPPLWFEFLHMLVHFPKNDVEMQQAGGMEGQKEVTGDNR